LPLNGESPETVVFQETKPVELSIIGSVEIVVLLANTSSDGRVMLTACKIAGEKVTLICQPISSVAFCTVMLTKKGTGSDFVPSAAI